MQTFLPFEDFRASAECLDVKRLGKQRVEAWQIWLAITEGSRWKNHPAVKMWHGHIWWLLLYGATVCEVWRERGYNDSLLPRFIDLLEKIECDEYPEWLGNENMHSSHRANLIRKDCNHYGSFGWNEKPETGYWWPSKE